MNRFVKSTLPVTRPSGGIKMSVTSDVVIFPNAAPMTTPTARSSTFPRETNSLNSLTMLMAPCVPGSGHERERHRAGSMHAFGAHDSAIAAPFACRPRKRGLARGDEVPPVGLAAGETHRAG